MKAQFRIIIVLAFLFTAAFSYAFTAVNDSATANAEPDVCCFLRVCPPGCTPGEEWGRPDTIDGLTCVHYDPALACEQFCDCW